MYGMYDERAIMGWNPDGSGKFNKAIPTRT